MLDTRYYTYSFFTYIIIAIILSIILYCISYFFIKKNKDLEKLTPYECGFNPYDDARKTFDIKFYLIGIIFIIFDLEAVYIFPWILTLNETGSIGFWTMFEFLVELVVGYIYVWKSLAFEWDYN